MKHKQKVDLIIALILLLIGIVLVLLPIYVVPNMSIIVRILFLSYAIINLVQYILTRKSKDYEGLHTCIVSVICLIATFIFDVTATAKTLAMTLMLWTTLFSLVKLKKVDYYHDKKDRMWKLRLFTLILFVLTGVAAAISLTYLSSVQTIVIGFFMIIHAILELFDPIVKTLIAHA